MVEKTLEKDGDWTSNKKIRKEYSFKIRGHALGNLLNSNRNEKLSFHKKENIKTILLGHKSKIQNKVDEELQQFLLKNTVWFQYR